MMPPQGHQEPNWKATSGQTRSLSFHSGSWCCWALQPVSSRGLSMRECCCCQWPPTINERWVHTGKWRDEQTACGCEPGKDKRHPHQSISDDDCQATLHLLPPCGCGSLVRPPQHIAPGQALVRYHEVTSINGPPCMGMFVCHHLQLMEFVFFCTTILVVFQLAFS